MQSVRGKPTGESTPSESSPPVPAKTPALPATPAESAVAKPAVKKEVAAAPANGMVELTPEERIAYKNYWQTFKSPKGPVGQTTPSPLSSRGSPSTASETPSSTGVVTPDVKKKLELDSEGLLHMLCFHPHGWN